MKLNRWLVAFLALTLALVASLSIVGCGGKKDPKPTVIPEGPETGVYYYDAEGDEYVVSLNNGNKIVKFPDFTVGKWQNRKPTPKCKYSLSDIVVDESISVT